MQNARIQTATLLVLLAPFVACAAGSMSSDVGPGPVTSQSEPTDAGALLEDTGTPPTSLPQPTANDGASSSPPGKDQDAGSPSNDDAATPPSEDAGPPPEDATPPPPPPPPPPVDSGSTASCPGFAPPTTPASCTCSAYAPETCTANNCYNGYYCELSDDKCVKEPAGC
jgi:hypothetical protein